MSDWEPIRFGTSTDQGIEDESPETTMPTPAGNKMRETMGYDWEPIRFSEGLGSDEPPLKEKSGWAGQAWKSTKATAYEAVRDLNDLAARIMMDGDDGINVRFPVDNWKRFFTLMGAKLR